MCPRPTVNLSLALAWFSLVQFIQTFYTPYQHLPLCRGLDPIVFAGLCGAASAVVGYMLGGTIFNATWRILSREKARQFDQVSLSKQ